MKRWHEDKKHTLRQFRLHKSVSQSTYYQHLVGIKREDIPVYKANVGRYRKRKAMDCGRADCKICHGDKTPKREKTPQEVKSELKMQDE